MKRIFALVLAVLMLLALVGCAAAPTAPAVTPDTPVSTPAQDSAETPDVSAEESVDGPAIETITFPLAETLTFSFWIEMATNYVPYASLAEHPAYIELEKRTNVSPEWYHPTASGTAEQFGLITASGDYYDAMYYPGGGSLTIPELYENEIAIDLTELIPQYMPNYNGIVEGNSELKRDVSDDEGRMLLVYSLQDQPVLNWWGLAIRQDILDDAGVSLPETYAEWETALNTLKAAGVERPLSIPKGGNFGASNFEAGFSTAAGFYQDNGVVKYGPMEDGFKDYLTQMNDWYNKGLIGSDFVGDDERFAGIPTIEDMLLGKVGSGVLTSSELGGAFGAEASDDEDFYLAAVPYPVKNVGDVQWSTSGGSGLLSTSFFISTNCPEEDIGTILSYFDYLYSEEGAELVSWGVEGDGFVRDENGERRYSDKVTTANFDDINTFHVYSLTMFKTPGLYNDKERYLGRTEDIVTMQSNWTKVGTGFGSLPSLTFTAEEAETYSGPTADCNTMVAENVARFIMGERPLSEFDDFRETLRSLGIETALEIYNTAYARYNTR